MSPNGSEKRLISVPKKSLVRGWTTKFEISYALFSTMLILVYILVCCPALLHCIRMQFNISTTWDGLDVNHEPVYIELLKGEEFKGVSVEVVAPFFNDPPAPSGQPGEPFQKLWDYEVVELFFLGKDEKYLEVELCPHGQHLLLLLSGRSNAVQSCMPLKFKAGVKGNVWRGEAEIPESYFPPDVTLFNAYAIHGSEEKRVYEALYPVPHSRYNEPNFHRLEYFKPIDLSGILPSNRASSLSDVWVEALKNKDCCGVPCGQ